MAAYRARIPRQANVKGKGKKANKNKGPPAKPFFQRQIPNRKGKNKI